jgi:dTDP-4-amino-4,6-dideoxygalactose transaminase
VVIAGGRPVFCDIDLATFNIDADKIEALITGKTKGIIAVHAFGLAADMAAVRKIAGKHRLFIIEDAACSFGAEYQGRKTGLFSDVGVFSFHPRKIITCGEGGCVVTNNRETAKKIACLRNHGEYDKKFINRGYNFRLSDIQAAVLDAQMERVDAIIERRIKLSRNYQALLKPWEKRGILKAPLCPRGYRHIYQSYVVLLADYVDRDKVKMFLKGKSIETQFGTYCVPALDYYLKNFPAPKEAYADAYYAFAHSLALPLYHTLSAGDQEYIIGRLNQAINMVAR